MFISKLFFLRKLKSFDVCQQMLNMFYQSVMASVLFYACVCWGGNVSKHDAGRFDKLVKKASSVVGLSLDTLLVTVERRIVRKTCSIMALQTHPLHSLFTAQRSSFSGRLVAPRCSTERFRRSFLPHAVRLYNERRGHFDEEICQ